MGLCLSCLGSNHTVQDDEDTSLLSDDKAKVLEDELLTELRNKQLNAILNSTNDHLIDISIVKAKSNYGSAISTHESEHDDTASQLQQDENDVFKLTPISQSVIQNEMTSQYNDWVARHGESAVRKYLSVPELENSGQSYSIDFV